MGAPATLPGVGLTTGALTPIPPTDCGSGQIARGTTARFQGDWLTGIGLACAAPLLSGP